MPLMFENFREMWLQATRGARAGLVGGVVLILAIVGYFAMSVLRVDYQTLFADLDPQDAASMVAELDKLHVPYRLNAEGTAIQVDSAQVHALRLKLMGKSSAMRGGVGFEIFNNTDFGMTEFAQKINYQRALQGEIARTVMGLGVVRQARVHLVLPDRGLFQQAQTAPKASISAFSSSVRNFSLSSFSQSSGTSSEGSSPAPTLSIPANTLPNTWSNRS
jgi:flagellar M-ring protein FliF